MITCYFISQLLKPAVLTNPLNPSCNANANSPQATKFQNSMYIYFARPNAASCTVLPLADAPFRPLSRRH